MIIKRMVGNQGQVYDDAKMIRQAVFVTEQGIDPKLEFDALDASLEHVVGYVDGQAVATTRLDQKSQHVKVQRVATLPAFRGRHLDSELLGEVLAALPTGTTVSLDAQQTAMGLYQRLGFRAIGDPFEEVGITHVAMVFEKK